MFAFPRDTERGGSAHLLPFGRWRAELKKKAFLSSLEAAGIGPDRRQLPQPNEEQLIYVPLAGTTPSVVLNDPQPLVTDPRGWAVEPAQAQCPGLGSLLWTTAPVKSGSDLRWLPSPRLSGTRQRRGSQGQGRRFWPVPLLAQGAGEPAAAGLRRAPVLLRGGRQQRGHSAGQGAPRGACMARRHHTLRKTAEPCLDCHPPSPSPSDAQQAFTTALCQAHLLEQRFGGFCRTAQLRV